MTYFEAGEWPVLYAGTGCSSFEDSGMEITQEIYEQAAADVLWNLTGRVFGTRTEIVRPVRVATPWRPTTFEGTGPSSAYYELGGFIGGWGWLPVYSNGSWITLRCGVCGNVACACRDSLKTIDLPGPVESVSEIIIGGIVLDPAAYRVDAGHILIRQDGESWPSKQDLLKAAGLEDTWTIEYTHGVPVPYGGQIAAGILACELYKAAIDDKDCRLPKRVSSVARQGVVVGLLDAFEGLENGETGIWAIDNWIASVNRPRDFVGIASPETIARGGYRIRDGYGPNR